jgi:hypothetical protein
MFENKLINGIHASRYVASWVRAGGELYYGEDVINFYRWLLSLGLTKDEAQHIKRIAENGKLELEVSAEKFIKTLPPTED